MTQTLSFQTDLLKTRITNLGTAVYSYFDDSLTAGVSSLSDAFLDLTASVTDGALSDDLAQIGAGLSSMIQSGAELAADVLPAVISGLAFLVEHGDALITMLGGAVAAYGAYQAAATVATIVADRITVGTMVGDIVKAGILGDAAGMNYWNMVTGEMKLSSTANISDALNQKNTFNALTNNGAYQGIWLSDGSLYIDGSIIRAGEINAENVGLTGKFHVYNGTDGDLGGFIGFMAGSDGVDVTNGIGVSDASGECYVVATNKGVRMQAGSTRMFIVKDGDAHIDGSLHVTGLVDAANITI